MELLSVDILFTSITALNNNNESIQFGMYGGAPVTGAQTYTNTRLIAASGHEMGLLTSGAVLVPYSYKFDLQSKDGYGYLFAGDILNFYILGNSTGVANSYSWKLYYRFVDVAITEFVGIVQSEQQGTG